MANEVVMKGGPGYSMPATDGVDYVSPSTAASMMASMAGSAAVSAVSSGASRSNNDAPNRSVVTSSSAQGFQISSTRDATVNYSFKITTAAQIGLVANVSGYVLLEKAATNSTTPSDWVAIGRTLQGQSISLAVALASNQTGGGQVGGFIPKGYYVRLRQVSVAGSPSFSVNEQQETLW